jgi:predicted PurR-regulated permease PerM
VTNTKREVYVQISTATVFRLLLAVLLLLFLYVIRDVLVIILFSVVIASAIGPAVNFLQNRRVPRTIAAFLVYILLFILLALLLYLIIRPLSNELTNLSETLPLYIDRVSVTFEEVRSTSPYYEQVLTSIRDSLGEVSGNLRSIATNIFAALARLFGGITSAVMVIVISFYLAAQEHGISNFLRAVTPPVHQSYVLNLWGRAQTKMGRWVRGQIVLSLSIGVSVFIGLSIFGIPYAIILALIAAIFEVIPFVGPILAAIPAVLLALLISPVVALWTVLVYVIVQQLENYLLAPKIMERAVGLNPIVVIVSLLIGGQLLGVIGIILAVPVAAVVVELIRDYGKRRAELSASA